MATDKQLIHNTTTLRTRDTTDYIYICIYESLLRHLKLLTAISPTSISLTNTIIIIVIIIITYEIAYNVNQFAINSVRAVQWEISKWSNAVLQDPGCSLAGCQSSSASRQTPPTQVSTSQPCGTVGRGFGDKIISWIFINAKQQCTTEQRYNIYQQLLTNYYYENTHCITL